MSTQIIAAIRSCSQLHGNLKFTAQEIAARLNSSGYGPIAYQFIAWKTGYSRRTIIRHVHRLVDELGIFAKTVYRTKNGYGWNSYKLLLPIIPFYVSAPVKTHSDNLTSTLPTSKTEEAKQLSLRDEIARLRKGLQFWTPGSLQWQSSQEKMTYLESLLRKE